MGDKSKFQVRWHRLANGNRVLHDVNTSEIYARVSRTPDGTWIASMFPHLHLDHLEEDAAIKRVEQECEVRDGVCAFEIQR